MSDAAMPATPTRQRTPWDAYRKVSAWMGLTAFVAVIVIIATVVAQFDGAGDVPNPTWAIIGGIGGPAVLAGIVSGSRYYALYAGYAERLDPTARLSAADTASGNTVVSSFIGDWLWGSLIAGIAGGVPATLALAVVLGPVTVIGLPVLVFTAGMTWFTGWVVGALASMLISSALGIAVGAARSSRPRTRLPWILVAAFLPALLITVSLSAAVRFPEGVDVVRGLLYLFGAPYDAEFLFGEPLLLVARLLAWLSLALFVVLVIVGLPALVNRGRAIPEPVVADEGPPPPIPQAPRS